MIFHRNRAEYTDGVIDLIPMHISPPDRNLGFGHEQIWKITLHNQKHEIGQISYRDGESVCVYYFGHIGYHIDPPYRGHGYAYNACILIREEIIRGGKTTAVITCDTDNTASRKTCEKLNCYLERVADVPAEIRQRYEISNRKCRYIWQITKDGEENGIC